MSEGINLNNMNKKDVIKREALKKLSELVKVSIENHVSKKLPFKEFVVKSPNKGKFTNEEWQEVGHNYKEIINSRARLYIFCRNNDINLPKEFESYLQRTVNDNIDEDY